MRKTNSESTDPIGNFQAPSWLTDLLLESNDYLAFNTVETEPGDKDFQKRCREAAFLAMSLSSLRKEKDRIGFVPLSLAAYLQGLFRVADVALQPILAWIGIEKLSDLNSAQVARLARLARDIGIELREALIHLRIGFAEQLDGTPMPLLVARQRSSAGAKRSSLEECETVLGEIELEYDLESLRVLRRTEFEFRSAYKEEDRSGV
jgi:hypothetical protein